MSTKSYFTKGYNMALARLIKNNFNTFRFNKFMYSHDRTKIVGILQLGVGKNLRKLRTTRMEIEQILEGYCTSAIELQISLEEYIDDMIDMFDEYQIELELENIEIERNNIERYY